MTARRLHSPPVTGNQFRAYMHEHGLRHTDVAELLDVSLRTVDRWVIAKQVPRIAEFALKYAVQVMGIKPKG